MVETLRSQKHDGEWDLSVFECQACGIDFFTEDHVPLTGPPGLANEQARPKLAVARTRAVVHGISSTRH
jgi:hypothetical protein